jgi:hypothetical protein
MTNVFNCSFITYNVLAKDSANNTYTFVGVFTTTPQMYDNTQITQWLLTNQSYKTIFENIRTNLYTNLTTYISGQVTVLKQMGLTDNQIDDIMESVVSGFDSTLATQQEVDLRVAEAETQGWNNAAQTFSAFFIVLIIIGIILYLKRERINLPTRKKPKEVFSYDDVFK